MVLASTVLTWYVARAAGILAFVLLTAGVVVGLALAGRARLQRWPRFAVEDVHRFLGLLAGSFVVLHGLALLVDGYLPFSLSQLLVPGTAPYRPLPTALGIVGAELLAALAITNRFRKRLSYRFWRRAHTLNFAVWLLALLHGITAGTDTGTAWGAGLYGVCTAAVAGAGAWRIARLDYEAARPRPPNPLPRRSSARQSSQRYPVSGGSPCRIR
jgi:sulfoxide reductase heme-binding subunit YedZ